MVGLLNKLMTAKQAIKGKRKEMVLAISSSSGVTKKVKTKKKKPTISKASGISKSLKFLQRRESLFTMAKIGTGRGIMLSTSALKRQHEIRNFTFMKHLVQLVYSYLLDFRF